MACDVITLVRQECKEINMIHQQPKRSGSASIRVCDRKRDFMSFSIISFFFS
jgi:hypothetical protein